MDTLRLDTTEQVTIKDDKICVPVINEKGVKMNLLFDKMDFIRELTFLTAISGESPSDEVIN